MNELKIFENTEFGTVRTDIDANGDVLFCDNDVAKALGYARPGKAIIDHCKGVLKRDTLTDGGKQELSFIPESDVYRLAFSSKLPNAERFTDWVTKEILPDIRKHGMYMTGEKLTQLLSEPRNAIELLTAYADEKEKNARLEQEKAQLAQENETMKPKAEFSDAVNNSKNGISVKQMAHLLNQNGFATGQNRLYEQLRTDGFLCTAKGSRFNAPMQSSINRGLMIVKEVHFQTKDGNAMVDLLPLITPKG